MRGSITLLCTAFALAAPAMAHAASVELRDVYARVQVIPEDRADVAVDVRTTDGKLPAPRISRSGGDVLVDGGLHPLSQCSGIHLGRWLYLPGHGYLGSGSALNITVHTPRDVRLIAGGAITGEVRPAQAVDLRITGCGHWRLADVSGTLAIDQAGAGNIVAGASARAVLDLSGVSHVDLGPTRGLRVDMSGVGKVRLKSIAGPVDANLSGMGSVDIAAGRAENVKADVSGMGGFNLHGSAGQLDADVSGIGGVHVDHVDGPIRKSVSGIGRISVGA